MKLLTTLYLISRFFVGLVVTMIGVINLIYYLEGYEPIIKLFRPVIASLALCTSGMITSIGGLMRKHE